MQDWLSLFVFQNTRRHIYYYNHATHCFDQPCQSAAFWPVLRRLRKQLLSGRRRGGTRWMDEDDKLNLSDVVPKLLENYQLDDHMVDLHGTGPKTHLVGVEFSFSKKRKLPQFSGQHVDRGALWPVLWILARFHPRHI